MDEHTLNDLLECSVCLERLDTSSKVLPCQHTFCRKCLEVIVSSRQELRCPECRVLVHIKIDELPPNVLLMRILEGMKNAAAARTQHQQEVASNRNDNRFVVDESQIQILNEEQQHQQRLKQSQQKQLLQYQQQQQYKQKQEAYQQQQQQLQQQQQTATQNPSNHIFSSSPTNANSAIGTAIATTQSVQLLPPPQQQQRRCIVPHAYALYDFESNEPTDLHFKKGDLILLKRKIDINWYVGQLNGGTGTTKEGTFPINYVQVIAPLPSPQCIALYDFKMGPNEEEGCLTFKKGTLIHVLRRVDHNWAEGRIASQIGIFPIAFVELNTLAKQLLDSFVLLNSPPPPPASAPTSGGSSAAGGGAQHQPTAKSHTAALHQIQQQQPRNPPPIPMLDPTVNSNTNDSTSSSNATSPNSTNTTCSSNTSSNSMPSSPNHSLPATPQHMPSNISSAGGGDGGGSVRYRDKREKRHSLNALLSAGGGALSILQSNRHSAEILSVPSEMCSSNAASPPTVAAAAAAEPLTRSIQNVHLHSTDPLHNSKRNAALISSTNSAAAIAAPQTTVAREQQQSQLPHSHARVNVLKTTVQQPIPTTLPWGYLALYPYKPRKSDELELKKGCVYIVTERCLDGWFKGKNWQDICGVFPGNYVAPLRNRDQQQLMHQWKIVPLQQQQQQSASQLQQQQQQSSPTTTNTKNQNHLDNLNTRLINDAGNCGLLPAQSHQPPDLPPRQNCPTTSTATSVAASSSVWTKPLGHTVEAFFNRSSSSSSSSSGNNKNHLNNVKDIKETKQKDVTSTSSTSSSSAAVSLMKRLAHIKSRSKSPSSAAIAVAVANNLNSSCMQQQQQQKASPINYSMDNPTFDETTTTTTSANTMMTQQGAAHLSNNTAAHAQIHPVHVRSGSCPSQLLQSLPMDLAINSAAQLNENVHSSQRQQQQQQQQHHQQQQQQQHMPQISPQATYGSQRIKGHKERPPLQNVRQSIDCSFRAMFNNAPATSGQKQQLQQQIPASSILTKCAQQQQQQTNYNINILNHRKSQSLDANTIMAAAATVPSSTITAAATITAAPCNITSAAIAASATTKSTQNTRESRFRCVVPYPPNSDIELELHVGDIIYVQRKQKNGWYKGTHARTNKTGLFPASFVEPDL